MRLVVDRDLTLPPLAWCVKLLSGSADVRLVCGASVEVHDDAFFEGAWDGSFAAMDFPAAAEVFGSGGAVRDGALLIVPPSMTLERIQYVQRGDETFISNSLCFLLEAAGEELDPSYVGYAGDFTKITVNGLESYLTEIPTRAGQSIHLNYFHNVRFTRDGAVEHIEKPANRPFATFDEYIALLTDTVKGAVANAADPSRITRYTPLASVSSGYDSPACCVIAARAGCTRAVTFGRSRQDGRDKSTDDSGKPIADALGFTLKEFQRDAYLNESDCPEAEFMATGQSGEDVNMKGFEAELRHAVFYTGFQGGKNWDMHIAPDPFIKRKDMSGGSMGEFRCRVDFIHVPISFIGARNHPQVHAIANSPELKRYSIGGDYDKPVARKLVEEAGVAREAFGMKKKATSALVHLRGFSVLSPDARQGILQFRDGQSLSPRTRLSYKANELFYRGGFFAMRALRKLKLLKFFPLIKEYPWAIHSHTNLGPLPMIWAVQRTGERYQPAARRLYTP